jgi:hypothetical protein
VPNKLADVLTSMQLNTALIHKIKAGNQLIAFWRGLDECDLPIAFKFLVKLVIIF